MYNLIIVEDNRSVLNLISQITDFNELGFSIVGLFRDGSKALEFIRNNKVDAIITDIKMPGIDGTELAEICHEEFSEIKIIFLSAFRDFEYARSAIKSDVFDYLTKPIDIDEFNDVLKKLKKNLDKNTTPSFSKTNIFYERLQVFEKITENNFSDDEIIEMLKECRINIQNKNPKIALFRFSLSNLEEYLNNFWIYGLEKLYIALYNFIPKDSSLVYFVISKTVYNEIEVTVIDNGCEDFRNKADEFKNQFVSNTKSFLKLEIRCVSSDFISSLSGITSKLLSSEEEANVSNEIMKKALIYIENNYGENISLSSISNQLYVSAKYLSKLFKKEINKNFIDYITEIRMKNAANYLLKSDKSIEEIFSLVGYSNKSHFYKVFKSYFGQTPNDYRNNKKRGD